MQLQINGQARQTRATTVDELIEEQGLTNHAVAVEVNKEVVPKDQHAKTNLRDGDQVELVSLVGGGG